MTILLWMCVWGSRFNRIDITMTAPQDLPLSSLSLCNKRRGEKRRDFLLYSVGLGSWLSAAAKKQVKLGPLHHHQLFSPSWDTHIIFFSCIMISFIIIMMMFSTDFFPLEFYMIPIGFSTFLCWWSFFRPDFCLSCISRQVSIPPCFSRPSVPLLMFPSLESPHDEHNNHSHHNYDLPPHPL